MELSKKIRVGLIYGGESFEHEVSKMTAKSVDDNIDRRFFDIEKIYIPINGRFEVSKLKGVDVAFLAVHGPNCEDGKLQRLLEKESIKYTGSGVLTSEINMDKDRMHSLLRQSGLPVVNFLSFENTDLDKIEKLVDQKLGYPCFVKPNNTGSSVGISKVKSQNQLKNAVEDAFRYDNRIVIEECINNLREIEASVLGNEKLLISAGEVTYLTEFYDYNAKYFSEDTHLSFNLNESILKEVSSLAQKAYKVTNCRGYARIDFFLETNKKLYINEINTLPGFATNSMFPKLMNKAGLSYKELITKIIMLALE